MKYRPYTESSAETALKGMSERSVARVIPNWVCVPRFPEESNSVAARHPLAALSFLVR